MRFIHSFSLVLASFSFLPLIGPIQANHQKFEIVIDSKDDSPALQSFVKEALSLLPPKMLEHLNRQHRHKFNRPTPLVFEKLSTHNELKGLMDGKPYTSDFFDLGQAEERRNGFFSKNWVIILDRALLKEIKRGPMEATAVDARHGTLYRSALATLIHEVAHLYDFSTRYVHRGHDYYDLHIQRQISHSGQFIPLAGWRRNGVLGTFHRTFNPIRSSNRLNNRSRPLRAISPHEFHSPEESFAINVEYFLLDPEFACRRPAMHQFLSQHFDYEPFPQKSCEINTTARLDSNAFTDASTETLVDLKPDRIFEIQYLQASEGKNFSSRFGHSMFVLVICDDSRPQPTKACRSDTHRHIVLNFRAHVQDINLDPWKALRGDYPSRPFLIPLTAIVKEYTALQFRDLEVYPLNLSWDQKQHFVYRVLELLSEYDGSYYFLDNNCSQESFNLLKSVIDDDETFVDAYVMTPRSLLRLAQRRGLIDRTQADLRTAQREGLYYSSEYSRLLQVWDRLPDEARAHWRNLIDYLERSTALDRRDTFELLMNSRDDLQRSIQTAAQFSLLENYFALLTRSEFIDRLFTEFTENEIQFTNDQLKEIQEQIAQLNASDEKGYGIAPLVTSSSHSEKYIELLGRQSRLVAKLIEERGDFAHDLIEEIQAIGKNQQIYRKAMTDKLRQHRRR